MIRTPLRPLAHIIKARADGENPDMIERENLRRRHDETRDRLRVRAEGRLIVMVMVFFCAFSLVGARMGLLAASDTLVPRGTGEAQRISATRADITDRHGRILATNMETYSLYAHPRDMIEPIRAAKALMGIFPDLDEASVIEKFTGRSPFVWVKRRISPEQKQAVHDIGEPGLVFGPREMRLYPNGPVAAHILGGTSYGREDVRAAEIVGVAGIERARNDVLRDPAMAGRSLALSLDLSVQAATERVLAGGMALMNAKGAAAIVMRCDTGEILSMASLPDFDPNKRPRISSDVAQEDSPLFNRAVQGVYELGSVFKTLTIAQALDMGIVSPQTTVDIRGPLRWGRHTINDFLYHGTDLSVEMILVESSNIGTARLAQRIGISDQQRFLRDLGLFEPLSIELAEANQGRPRLPKNWSELSTMTISYGHGLSVTPLHLATSYATVCNGGTKVAPTLIKRDIIETGPRLLSLPAAMQTTAMMRQVVVHEKGTASMANVGGYAVAGKTGSADKYDARNGGYHEDRVIATFASVFPADRPEYVLVVMLDEPAVHNGDEIKRTAGWTAVPVAAEIINRIAPMLVAPTPNGPRALARVSLTSR
ncbi:MAG: penicillin-binding protein 2 [Pseudoprimorskyibacter sp.]|nr:penicillin-binding protein 2 [Pseudoprimorskyibacter sp.]